MLALACFSLSHIGLLFVYSRYSMPPMFTASLEEPEGTNQPESVVPASAAFLA